MVAPSTGQSHDYKRYGTTTMFAPGKIIAKHANAQRNDGTVWTHVTDRNIQSKLSRWSSRRRCSAACATCYLGVFQTTILLLGTQQVCLGLLMEAILLAPLLVLFAFRHLWPVVFIYASALLLILVLRVDYIARYYAFGVSALPLKIDEPGLHLGLLGMVSMAVVLVWAIGFRRCAATDKM
jgi:hypothetical protein